MDTRGLLDAIEKIKRERMLSEKVVDLGSFKKMRNREEPTTILIIDDDPTIRGALKRVFEKEGYDVAAVNDGTDLKNILETKELRLMIIDVGLPWVDGLELCALFRRHNSYKNIPIIIISAYGTDEDIRKGLAAGCDTYFVKPFNIDELIASVSSMLTLKEGG